MKRIMLRLAGLLAIGVLLTVFAPGCGGSGGSESDGDGGGDIPAGLSLLIYKETLSNTIYAEQLPDVRYWRFTAESSEEFLTAIDCTRDGQWAAYLMQSVASGTRLKISGRAEPIAISGQASGLAWAPDGSRIAVTTFDSATSANQILLVDAESGEISVAAAGQGAIGAPHWSPDGARIAFDASDGTTNQIFVHAIGTEGTSRLTQRQGNAFSPDWSPDGLTLLFSGADPAGIYQIFRVNADGSNEVQLTTSNVGKALPRWAPDGTLIAFAGTVVVPAASARPAVAHNLAVYTVGPDGTNEQAVTDLSADARLGGWCLSGPWLSENWTETS